MGGVSMEWKEVKIGDLGQIITGKTPKTAIKKNWGGKIPFLSPSDDMSNKTSPVTARTLTELGVAEVAKCLIPANSICVSCIGSDLGKVVKTDRELVTNQQINTIVPHSNVDSDFVYYLMCIVGKELNYISKTSTAVPIINKSTFSDWNIVIPEKVEDQRRIASILSSLDRKIELNNKINADLEEMAQAIFKNWLSECSDDVTIGELSLNITNYEKTDAEEVVLINSSDVTEGYFDHHNYSPNKNLKGHFKKRFQKGDILYSQVRPRNRHWAYCNFDANDYLASTQLMVIRNNPSLITSILLYQYIISDNVWKEFTLKTETRSGTFPQGNYEDLSQIRVPYNSDVEGISNQLETLYAKMFMLEKENSRLSLLRDTLLPRLMSGELEVPE